MLIGLVRSAAAAAPDQPVIIGRNGTTTYAECLDRAESLARGIARSGLWRFGCRTDDPAELLEVLVAASAVGAEACVYPAGPPEQLRELAERFEHEVVVAGPDLDIGIPTVTPASLLDSGSAPLPEPGATPLLILTTGTTGKPKGAHHDWSRLVAGLRNIESGSGARWLLAYNLNQFAGLQVLLYVLAGRATLVVPRSNQPREAIGAMETHQVTHASATPTFWRYVVAVLDEATASRIPLRQITLGGEAVPAPLLDRLGALFPTARISQVYASTEFGSGVSVGDRRSGLPLSVLERSDDADVQYRIEDGELQVRSTVGMVGYFGQEQEGDRWRPTGDLVEVRDGRIHFVGRAGDTINVGGVKIHPLPIEEIVSAVEGVDLVRAYGRPNPMSGHIVAVDVVAAPGVDTDSLSAAIRAACDQLAPAARPRRIRFVDDLDVHGGKVARPGGADDGT